MNAGYRIVWAYRYKDCYKQISSDDFGHDGIETNVITSVEYILLEKKIDKFVDHGSRFRSSSPDHSRARPSSGLPSKMAKKQ